MRRSKSNQLEQQGANRLVVVLRLTHILEVVGEVGVNRVGSPTVPEFRSFGTRHCASSEGFLATFTPGKVLGEDVAWRIFSAYCFHLGFIQIPQVTAEKLQPGRVAQRTLDTRVVPIGFLPKETKDTLYSVWSLRPPKVPRGSSSTELGIRGILRWNIPRELMILAAFDTRARSAGILEASNPTEEVLWQDRNTDQGEPRQKFLTSFFAKRPIPLQHTQGYRAHYKRNHTRKEFRHEYSFE